MKGTGGELVVCEKNVFFSSEGAHNGLNCSPQQVVDNRSGVDVLKRWAVCYWQLKKKMCVRSLEL